MGFGNDIGMMFVDILEGDRVVRIILSDNLLLPKWLGLFTKDKPISWNIRMKKQFIKSGTFLLYWLFRSHSQILKPLVLLSVLFKDYL